MRCDIPHGNICRNATALEAVPDLPVVSKASTFRASRRGGRPPRLWPHAVEVGSAWLPRSGLIIRPETRDLGRIPPPSTTQMDQVPFASRAARDASISWRVSVLPSTWRTSKPSRDNCRRISPIEMYAPVWAISKARSSTVLSVVIYLSPDAGRSGCCDPGRAPLQGRWARPRPLKRLDEVVSLGIIGGNASVQHRTL